MKHFLLMLAALLLAPLASLHADADLFSQATISPVTEAQHGQWNVALTELTPGRVLAIWEAGHTEVKTANAIMAAVSENGGRSWSERRDFFRREGLRCTPCGFYRSGDAIHCLIMEVPLAGGAQPCRALDLVSADGGATWSEPREIWRAKSGVVMRPVVMRDGRIALPVYRSGSGHDGKTTSLASVLVSKDDGATWQQGAVIPCDLPGGAMEPTLAETSDGGWLCIVRTRGTGALFASRSQDGGQTWEVAAPLPLESPESIACLLRLADGSLLVAWNGLASKTQGPRNRLTGARSLDGGRTWPQRRDLVRANDGSVFSNHGVLQLADGRILVGYQHFHRDTKRAPQRSGVDSVELASFDLRWLVEGKK